MKTTLRVHFSSCCSDCVWLFCIFFFYVYFFPFTFVKLHQTMSISLLRLAFLLWRSVFSNSLVLSAYCLGVRLMLSDISLTNIRNITGPITDPECTSLRIAIRLTSRPPLHFLQSGAENVRTLLSVRKASASRRFESYAFTKFRKNRKLLRPKSPTKVSCTLVSPLLKILVSPLFCKGK